MKGMIGQLDWDECDTCFHWNPETGNCEVSDSEFEDRIEIDMGFVYCGCYNKEIDK